MLRGFPDLGSKVVFSASTDTGIVFGFPLGRVTQPTHVEIANGGYHVDSE